LTSYNLRDRLDIARSTDGTDGARRPEEVKVAAVASAVGAFGRQRHLTVTRLISVAPQSHSRRPTFGTRFRSPKTVNNNQLD